MKALSTVSLLRSSLLLVSLAACSMIPAFGQATTGSISGRVTDPSGAALRGAQVIIRNTDKGLATTVQTDAAGGFIATAMPPDNYTITVELSGFATATVRQFKLNIDQKARFEIPMKVGRVTADVTVTDTAPILQVQGAETGQVIGSRAIEDLPTLGRDFTTLMYLVPGVTYSPSKNSNLSLSVNGQRGYSNSYQINGVEVSGMNNDTNVRPSPDAIQEFKIVTSSYAPEFGRASGGVVLIQTKSGTNSYHGSDFFFYRPTVTAANNPFAPPGTSPTTMQKNYGATIGGPLRKDKAFFFLGYEGYLENFSSSYFGETLVGRDQAVFEDSGDVDLSGLMDPYTGLQVPIFDPFFFASNYYTSQFPGNVIPAGYVSPAGRQIVENLFPSPRGPYKDTNPYLNFQTTQYYGLSSNVGNLRLDYNFSPANTAHLTYDAEQGVYTVSDPYQGAISQKGGGGADSAGETSYENHSIALTYDHIFSPSLLNEARASYFVSPTNQSGTLDGTKLAEKYGIANANIPGFPGTYGFPQIQMGSGATTGGSTWRPLNVRLKVLGLLDTLTWTHGRHNIKLGYEFRRLVSTSNYSLFPVPYEYFAGPGFNFTSDPYYGYYDPSAYYYNGGAEIADLLLGLPWVVDQGLQLATPTTLSNEHTFYLQDYWQVTPKLNLSYGLRYEYVQPWMEKQNRQSNFDIDAMVMNIAGRGGNSRSLVDSNMHNFMPRVGIAYQLSPKTVIRAGFGIFYSHENDGRNVISTQNYPFYSQQQYVNDAYYYGYTLDAGQPRPTTNPVPPDVASVDMTTVPNSTSQQVTSQPKNFPTGFSRNYNLTVQQQIGQSTSFELGFVGANSRDLSVSAGNYNVNNHLSALLGKVNVLQTSGLSNYNSMQVKLTRQVAQGYTVIGSYTWAHNLDNGPAPADFGLGNNYPQNPFDIGAEYGNSSIDVRNNFTAAQIIDLPFGRGRHFLSGIGPVADAFLGGWQLNSITMMHTGTPINIISNANNSNYPGLRPDLVGNPNVSHRSIQGWFNPAAFALPDGQQASSQPGSTGPLVVGNLARNMIFGPGYTNEDLSLFKVFTLTREMKFQVRIAGFNVLNTAHYGQPDGNFAHYNPNNPSGSSFGKITGGSGGQRILQFGGRLVF